MPPEEPAPTGASEETESEETEETESDEPDHEADAKKWKALARKHEKQAKANADAAKKMKEIEDEKKSSEQKAADERAKDQRERDDAKLEAARLRVALKKGLTEVQAKRLIGDNEEELEADADELLESFGTNGDGNEDEKGTKGDKSKKGPKEKLRSGATSTTESEITDYREHASKLPKY